MPENKQEIQLFENQRVRTAWDADKQERFLSVVDVVGVLTDSSNPNNCGKYSNPGWSKRESAGYKLQPTENVFAQGWETL